MVAGRILLVRHTEVAVKWSKACYGRLDVGLSRAGQQRAGEIASELARQPITTVVHSGLKRAAVLASRLALLKGLVPLVDALWRERDFGTLEGRGWHSIWRETGNAMDGLFTEPDHYRPGGGETTAEMAARCIAAWHSLPQDGIVAVISHGGPIAAVRTMLASVPMRDILHYTVATGAVVSCRRGLSFVTGSQSAPARARGARTT